MIPKSVEPMIAVLVLSGIMLGHVTAVTVANAQETILINKCNYTIDMVLGRSNDSWNSCRKTCEDIKETAEYECSYSDTESVLQKDKERNERLAQLRCENFVSAFNKHCQPMESTRQEARVEKQITTDSDFTGCSVAAQESALFDLVDPILDLADATVHAERAYTQLVQNADPGDSRTSVVVDDLERLIDDMFSAGSKLDQNNLAHLHGQEMAERDTMDRCVDDHYRAQRVASSCADELGEYRRAIRSLAILAEDLILAISNAESAGGDITINASTLWPTSDVRTNVRNDDLNRMNRLIREAKTIRIQLEGEARAERHPRRALYRCIRQTPNY